MSLVPSLTEAVAATAPGTLVGATDWCTHPADLDVARVGGTKWPDVAKVIALRPDLVLANREENREEDVEALRAAGLRVHVTYPRTVAEALDELRDICVLLDSPDPQWLRKARAAWEFTPAVTRKVAVPIWRRPWMWLGDDTFAADVLRRLGYSTVHSGRYPKKSVKETIDLEPDIIVFPDEPYAFHPGDGPEAFGEFRSAFVSGRHLTWYGPSLTDAPTFLTDQLS
ncbi:ABC-type hemin transport system substrate-binding protein [Longispora fulva]|uniref:ABC-type hemin transport system substrate-binding protein n=1 Tax=Longispora fulva TaxID=619741 RepID=A0A8J7GMG9_9ACTN|nr:ABC-type hemin transport system substrate-binding protein [Longispora fulva]